MSKKCIKNTGLVLVSANVVILKVRDKLSNGNADIQRVSL